MSCFSFVVSQFACAGLSTTTRQRQQTQHGLPSVGLGIADRDSPVSGSPVYHALPRLRIPGNRRRAFSAWD
jgi:hypothetical protein